MPVHTDVKPCRQCGTTVGVDRDTGLCLNCAGLAASPDRLATRTTIGAVPFADMKHVDETLRFDAIAKYLRANPGKLVAVMVDTGPDHHGKGDRYIAEITTRVPTAKVVRRNPGPVADVETIGFRNTP